MAYLESLISTTRDVILLLGIGRDERSSFLGDFQLAPHPTAQCTQLAWGRCPKGILFRTSPKHVQTRSRRSGVRLPSGTEVQRDVRADLIEIV